MKYGVIDVGSNSVRLMISDGVRAIYKIVKTTRLAEGLGQDKTLKEQPIFRSVLAISELYNIALKEKVDKIFIFATAAVRQAKNQEDFLLAVKNACGLEVEVVSGLKEAEIGLKGALGGVDGGVIDIGGASTEIAVVKNSNIVYSKSINIGAVSLMDLCGQDRFSAEKIVQSKIKEFGLVDKTQFRSIGGTATSVGAILQRLDVYVPEKIDGFVLDCQSLDQLTDKLYKMTLEERAKLKGLQPERVKVIACGCLILLEIMRYLNLDKLEISDKDNLEGYLMDKLELL